MLVVASYVIVICDDASGLNFSRDSRCGQPIHTLLSECVRIRCQLCPVERYGQSASKGQVLSNHCAQIINRLSSLLVSSSKDPLDLLDMTNSAYWSLGGKALVSSIGGSISV